VSIFAGSFADRTSAGVTDVTSDWRRAQSVGGTGIGGGSGTLGGFALLGGAFAKGVVSSGPFFHGPLEDHEVRVHAPRSTRVPRALEPRPGWLSEQEWLTEQVATCEASTSGVFGRSGGAPFVAAAPVAFAVAPVPASPAVAPSRREHPSDVTRRSAPAQRRTVIDRHRTRRPVIRPGRVGSPLGADLGFGGRPGAGAARASES
jgi:hypothetical protein